MLKCKGCIVQQGLEPVHHLRCPTQDRDRWFSLRTAPMLPWCPPAAFNNLAQQASSRELLRRASYICAQGVQCETFGDFEKVGFFPEHALLFASSPTPKITLPLLTGPMGKLGRAAWRGAPVRPQLFCQREGEAPFHLHRVSQPEPAVPAGQLAGSVYQAVGSGGLRIQMLHLSNREQQRSLRGLLQGVSGLYPCKSRDLLRCSQGVLICKQDASSDVAGDLDAVHTAGPSTRCKHETHILCGDLAQLGQQHPGTSSSFILCKFDRCLK